MTDIQVWYMCSVKYIIKFSVQKVQVVLVFGVLLLAPPDVLCFEFLVLHEEGGLGFELRRDLFYRLGQIAFILHHVTLNLELLRVDYVLHIV